MDINVSDFSARQTGDLPGSAQPETISVAAFVSRSGVNSGVKQQVTLVDPVLSQTAAPAECASTVGSPEQTLSAVAKIDKVTRKCLMGLSADHGIRTLALTEADPLQGINREDPDSAFRLMCIEDDSKKVLCLLAEMDDENRQDWLIKPLDYSEQCDTPIIYAARRGCASVVSALLQFKADPLAENPHSEQKHHALMIAAQNNHGKVIEAMARHPEFEPDKPIGNNGVTALYIAIDNNAIDAVEKLLELVADPNYTIHRCVHRDQNTIVPGENPVQQYGSILPTIVLTPVIYAVTKGNVEILKKLLENGGSVANPDLDNPLQESPLGKALHPRCRLPEVVALLLRYGANMHERIPVYPETYVNEKLLPYRPSLLEYLCHKSSETELPPCLEVLYEHFSETSHIEITTWEFYYFFQFMYLVKALYSYHMTREDPPDLCEYSHIVKNITAVEILLSSLRSDKSNQSEEDKEIFLTVYECYRALLKIDLNIPLTTSEFEKSVLAWLKKVEVMGTNMLLLKYTILGLLGQRAEIILVESSCTLPGMFRRSVQASQYFFNKF